VGSFSIHLSIDLAKMPSLKAIQIDDLIVDAHRISHGCNCFFLGSAPQVVFVGDLRYFSPMSDQPQRKVIHVDMDCFYAAVEVRDRPDLRGKPVVVGGHPDGRGVIATASYEARKFGVKSAMSSRAALRLCPELIFVATHFGRYKQESKAIREIFERFTKVIEPLSLDEAYLDVTDCREFDNNATKIAHEIRRLIFVERGLTASAGIAPNKFLAKVASEWKKPNGQFTVTPDQVEAFVEQLPVGDILGVGKVTEQKMHKLGFQTCGDLQLKTRAELESNFGSWGHRLYEISRGIDHRPVKVSRQRKSLSVETTYSKSLKDFDSGRPSIGKLYDEFLSRAQRLEGIGRKTKSYFVKIKFDDFSQITREKQWNSACESDLPTIEHFLEIYEQGWAGQVLPVRLLGMGVRLQSKSSPKSSASQLALF
jgi:DNA polymerase-4